MKLVNRTPHSVLVVDKDGRSVEIPPEGTAARVSSVRWQEGWVEVNDLRVPVCRFLRGAATDLPPPEPGTRYIVSRLVAETVPEREDLLVPADLVRDSRGRSSGCQMFGRPETPLPLERITAYVHTQVARMFEGAPLLEEGILEGLRSRLAMLNGALASADALRIELERETSVALLAALARVSGMTPEAVAATLHEGPAFASARRLLGVRALEHPDFLRWLARAQGAETLFESILRESSHFIEEGPTLQVSSDTSTGR